MIPVNSSQGASRFLLWLRIAARTSGKGPMKRFVSSILLQIACVILPSAMAPAQTVNDRDIASRVSAYLRPFTESGNLSGTVLIARTGRVLFRQSYGMANYELRVP